MLSIGGQHQSIGRMADKACMYYMSTVTLFGLHSEEIISAVDLTVP